MMHVLDLARVLFGTQLFGASYTACGVSDRHSTPVCFTTLRCGQGVPNRLARPRVGWQDRTSRSLLLLGLHHRPSDYHSFHEPRLRHRQGIQPHERLQQRMPRTAGRPLDRFPPPPITAPLKLGALLDVLGSSRLYA
ncbi:unnamed protein product [Cercospora beticola]|nr:unnamed protein product [Cercospora beticola]